MEDLERMDKYVPDVLEQNGIWEEFLLQRIVISWPEIVGKSIAAHSYVGKPEPPEIIVFVYNNVWLQQLNMNKAILLEKINSFYGKPIFTNIKLLMARKKKDRYLFLLPEEEKITSQNIGDISLDKETVQGIDRSVSMVSDSKMKNILRSLRIRMKQREKALILEGYQVCSKCGLFYKKEEEVCIACLYKKHRQKIIEIKKILNKSPFGRYEDIKENIICTYEEFGEAKKELLYFYLDLIYKGSTDKMVMYKVAMLITGKSKDALSDDFVENLAKKYRKKERK